jgi:hypothetical protein
MGRRASFIFIFIFIVLFSFSGTAHEHRGVLDENKDECESTRQEPEAKRENANRRLRWRRLNHKPQTLNLKP